MEISHVGLLKNDAKIFKALRRPSACSRAERCGCCVQREVSRKLYMQLPELSQHLDRTLARAPKDEYGPPPQQLWRNLVVSCLPSELFLLETLSNIKSYS